MDFPAFKLSGAVGGEDFGEVFHWDGGAFAEGLQAERAGSDYRLRKSYGEVFDSCVRDFPAVILAKSQAA